MTAENARLRTDRKREMKRQTQFGSVAEALSGASFGFGGCLFAFRGAAVVSSERRRREDAAAILQSRIEDSSLAFDGL